MKEELLNIANALKKIGSMNDEQKEENKALSFKYFGKKPMTEEEHETFLNQIGFNGIDKEIVSKRFDLNATQELIEWSKINQEKAGKFRGRYGETLFHNAAISNTGWVLILLENDNVDLQAKDIYGDTAFDWLINKYDVHVVNNCLNLPDKGRKLLAEQCLQLAITLHKIGISYREENEPINYFSKVGGFGFINYILENKNYGVEALRKLGNRRCSFVHNWLLIEKSEEKNKFLKKYVNEFQLPLDLTDDFNLTPLSYIVEGIASKANEPKIIKFLLDSLRTLIGLGLKPKKDEIAIQLYQQFCLSEEKAIVEAMKTLKKYFE